MDKKTYYRRIGKENGGDKYGWGKPEEFKGINGENRCDVCSQQLWVNPGGGIYCNDCTNCDHEPKHYGGLCNECYDKKHQDHDKDENGYCCDRSKGYSPCAVTGCTYMVEDTSERGLCPKHEREFRRVE